MGGKFAINSQERNC